MASFGGLNNLFGSSPVEQVQDVELVQQQQKRMEQQGQQGDFTDLQLKVLQGDSNDNMKCSLSCDIYQVADTQLCLFCIKYCQQKLNSYTLDQDWFVKKKEFDIKSNSLLQPFKCHCDADHFEDRQWMKNQVSNIFKDIFITNQETIPLFNQFMTTQFHQETVLQYAFSEETALLKVWKNSVETDVFDWNDLNVQDVISVIGFLDILVPDASCQIEKDTWRLGILNVEYVISLLDLNFIWKFIKIKTTSRDFEQEEENIIDQLQPSINQIQAEVQIKNRLLTLVDIYYLQKIIRNFDKIDPLEIQSLSPMSRIKIDSQNVQQFNEQTVVTPRDTSIYSQQFDFCEFAKDALTYMIRQETIPEIIKESRVMPLAFIRYIAEYRIAGENQFQKLQHILFDKYAMFKNFEIKQKSVKGDVDEIIVKNLQIIREDYATFFVNQIFKYGDIDLKQRLEKVYNKGKIMKDIDQIEESLKYERQFLHDDFSAKILDLMLGYILNQVKIQNFSLLTEKLYNIMDNAIFFFFNSQDTYSQNFFMLTYDDFQHYFDINNPIIASQSQVPIKLIQQNWADISKKVLNIFEQFALGKFQGKNNDNFIQQLEEIVTMQYIITDIKNQYPETNQELLEYVIRNEMFRHRIVLDILQLLKIYDIHKDQNENDKHCIQECLKIVETYLQQSVENQAIFLQQYYYDIIQGLFQDEPVIMSQFYLTVFKNSSQVLSENYNFLRLVLKQMNSTIKNKEENFKPKKKIVVTNLLQLVICFIKDSSKSGSTGDIPYCDIIIQKQLMFLDHYLSNPHTIELIINYSHNDKNSKGRKLFIQMILCIKHVIKKRITIEFYNFLLKYFNLERIIQLIQLCENQLDIRKNLIDIYCQIHVNLKNLLYDDRSLFVEDELGYSETRTLQDKIFKYKIQLEFVIKELLFTIEFYDQNDSSNLRTQAQKHMTNQVMVMTKNMFDLFASQIQDEDLFKESKGEKESLGDKIMRMSYILDTNSHKIQFIMGKEFDNTKKTHESVKNKIDLRVKQIAQVYQRKSRIQEHIWQIQAMIQDLIIIQQKEGILDQNIKTTYVSDIKASKHKRQYFKFKSREKRVRTTIMRAKRFSNSMKEREEYLEFLIQEKLDNDFLDENNRPDISQILYRSYQLMKYKLFSTKASENRFINIFNQSTADSLNYSYNFVYFVNISFVDVEKSNNAIGDAASDFIDENYIFGIVEALCHALFLATENIQHGFKQLTDNLTKEDQGELMTDVIWQVMKQKYNYVTNKILMDESWKINYSRLLLLIKLHQFLCEQNNLEIKKFFQNKINEKSVEGSLFKINDNDDCTEEKMNNRINRIMKMVLSLCQQRHWDVASHQHIQDLDRPYQNNPELLPIACYFFDLLAELCSGPCSKNQQLLAKFTYDSYIILLERNVSNVESYFYDLKQSLVDFLMAFTEGMSQKIIPVFTITFNAQMMWDIITKSVKQIFYAQYEDKKYYPFNGELDKEELEVLKLYYEHNENGFSHHPLMNIAINFYILIKKLAEINSKFEQFIVQMENQLNDPDGDRSPDILLLDFLKHVTTHIEIINLKNQVERYYFKTPPITYFLKNDQKEDFLDNVDRSSVSSKLSSLLRKCEIFEFQMDYRQKQVNIGNQLLNKNQTQISFHYNTVSSPYWLPHIKNFFRQIYLNFCILCIWLIRSGNIGYDLKATIILSLIINYIVLTEFKVETSNRIPISTVYRGNHQKLIMALTIIITQRAVIGLLFWMLLDLKIIYKQWEYTQLKIDTAHNSYEEYEIRPQKNPIVRLFNGIEYLGTFIVFLVKNHNVPIFLLFNMIAILLGYFWNISFLAFSLFSLIAIFNSMLYVVKAIAINASKLIYLIIFTCILFFSFSLISHVFFRGAFDGEECQTLQLCYLNTLQQFFINNEGVGSVAKQQSYAADNKKNYYGFTVFQLVFFMLINVMIINIIQAFIVDTFSNLRNEEDYLNNDIEKFCFICNITRYDFQKAGVRFEDHKKYEHNIWSYVKFIIFMKNRTLKDCNGLEIQLQQKILSNDISFFPLNRSLSLGNLESINDSLYMQLKIQKKLEKLQDYLSTIQQKTLNRQ